MDFTWCFKLRPPYPAPTNLYDINQWPRKLLDRCVQLWGEDNIVKQLRTWPAFGLVSIVKIWLVLLHRIACCMIDVIFPSGQVKWRVVSLFTGIGCMREAIDILKVAILDRWGIRLDIQYVVHASWLNRMCIQLTCFIALTSTCVWDVFQSRWKRTTPAKVLCKTISLTRAWSQTLITCWSDSQLLGMLDNCVWQTGSAVQHTGMSILFAFHDFVAALPCFNPTNSDLVKYCAWSTWGAPWTLVMILWVRLGPHASLTQGVLPQFCCL